MKNIDHKNFTLNGNLNIYYKIVNDIIFLNFHTKIVILKIYIFFHLVLSVDNRDGHIPFVSKVIHNKGGQSE